MATTCIIERDDKKRVRKVKTLSGGKSTLFDKIASIPLMENRERALSIFKTVYSSKFKKLFGDWTVNTPINRKAFNQVKKNIQLVPEQYRDAVLEKASKMDNPIMVSKVNVGENRQIDGLSYYSTSLEENNVFLVDALSPSDITLDKSNIPDGSTEDDYRKDIISNDFSPVINITELDGSNLVAIRDGLAVHSPESLTSEESSNIGLTFESGEPRLFFVTDDNSMYEDYGSALRASKGGTEIRAGFVAGTIQEVTDPKLATAAAAFSSGKYYLNDEKAFIPLMSLATNTNIATRHGMINYLIKKGYLFGSKIYDADTNQYYYIGEGYTGQRQMFNSASSYFQISNIFGSRNVTINDRGLISIANIDTKNVEVIDDKGKKGKVSKENIINDLKASKYNELDKNYQHFDALVLSLILGDNSIYSDNVRSLISNAKQEDLRQRTAIIDILSSLGVRVVGMTDYMDKYKTKYGHEPSARALADIANNIIAVSENATLNDILEETAHFLVEAYTDQDAVRDVLNDVEGTQEWNTYAGQYYDVYGKTLEGKELDDAVHREILGKIISNRFRSSFETSEEIGFLSRVRALVSDMINSIRGMITNQKSKLNDVIEDIKNSALASNPTAFDTSLLKDNTFTLYSLTAKEQNSFLQNRIDELKRTLKDLRQIDYSRRGRDGNGSYVSSVSADMSLNQLRSIEKKIAETEQLIDDNEMIMSLNSMINTAEAQTNYIKQITKEALTSGEDGKLHLSFSDRQNVQIVDSQTLPMLEKIRGFVKNRSDFSGDLKQSYINRIDKVVADINGVKSDVDSVMDIDRHTFVTSIMDMFNIPEDKRSRIYDMFDHIQKDISVISRWFGILEHSSNVVNNALGGLIAQNNYNAMVKSQDIINKFLEDVKKNGWNVEKFNKLLQVVDGKTSRFLKSSLNMAQFEKNYKIQQMKAFAQVLPELSNLTDTEIEDIVDKDKSYAIKVETEENGKMVKKTIQVRPSMDRVNLDIMSVEQEQRYQAIMNEWLDANTEQPFKESFRSQLNRLYAEVDRNLESPISQETKEFLNNLSRQKYMLKQPFYDVNGKFDDLAFAKSSNYQDYMRLVKQKKEAASEWVYTGTSSIRTRKTGAALKMAEDIKAIDEAWKRELGSRVTSSRISPAFMSTLRQVQSEGGALDAFTLFTQSGHVSFSDKFWNSMGDDQVGTTASNNVARYEELGEAIIESSYSLTARKDVTNILEVIRENKAMIKDIISFNRDSSNPGEIAYASFTSAELESVKICSEKIEEAYSQLIDLAKQADLKPENYLRMSTKAENEVNETYLNELKDSGLEEWEFALKHTTSKKAERIKNFRHKIEGMGDNLYTFTSAETRFLADYLGIDPTLSKAKFKSAVNVKTAFMTKEERNALTGKFARSMVLSYFKRLAPVGYSEFMNRIKNNSIDVAVLAEDLQNGTVSQDYGFDLSYFKFDANRQWVEENENEDNGKNPNYRPNHGYGRFLPKREIYEDKDFINEFGIIRNADGTETATRNLESYNMIQNLKQIMQSSVESYGERNRNLYSIPQISAQSIERLSKLGTDLKGVTSNFIRDLVMDRVDDSLYGRTNNDESIDPMDRPKIIPKYYLNELENQNDISHDLAFSYSMLITQAKLYEEKQNTIETAMGLQQTLLNMQFNKGKKPEATQAYAMFNDFMNDYFFGIRSNTKKITWSIGGYEIDVTKIMMGVERFMSTMNLALSPFVAATGALTGQVNFFIESAVGQYISKDSIGYAYKELARLAPSYINEIGDIDRKSKLYILGERLGVFNMRNRLHGAGYNRVMRTLTRDPLYKFMEVFNAPLDPQIMIASLDNTRYYNGRFYTFNEFKNMMEKNGESGIIRSTWNTLREESLWNYIDVVDGKVITRKGGAASEQQILDRLATARNQIKSLMQICNGSLNEENRIAATRNWMWRFTTAHRGWLVLAAQRMWKSKGYNFQTGQFEEGLCVTLKNMLGKSFSILSEKGVSGFLDAWKAEKNNLSEEEKVNLKRSAVYLATFLIMQGVSAALFGWRDDDDKEDSWLSQFATYVGMRTINEIASQMPILMEQNIVDIVTDPFVVARKVKDFTNLDNYSLNKVTSGAYEGETKLWRLLAKQTFLKQWYNIKTPEDIKRASDWWLQTNRQSMMFFIGANRDKEEGNDDTTFK